MDEFTTENLVVKATIRWDGIVNNWHKVEGWDNSPRWNPSWYAQYEAALKLARQNRWSGGDS